MGAGRRPSRGRPRAGQGHAVTVPSCRLLTEGTHSDFTFRVGDAALRVHRAVLLARAPLICEGLAGGQLPPGELRLDGMGPAEFRGFLR